MDQTRPSCEFGANPFSGSRDISYTNKKTQTDGAENRTSRSSLRAVKINYHEHFQISCYIVTMDCTLTSAHKLAQITLTVCKIHTNIWSYAFADNFRANSAARPRHCVAYLLCH